MRNHVATVALEPANLDEIRAAHAAGLSVVAWRAAGRPTARITKGQKPKGALRPWHPYRSKWEADYSQYLELLRASGRILGWGYECERLSIGHGAVYTPDFLLTMPDGSNEVHEVKGYRREAAMVRIRVAAKLYPQFRFVLVTKVSGQWKHTTIGVKP